MFIIVMLGGWFWSAVYIESLIGNVIVSSAADSSCGNMSWAIVSCAQSTPSISYWDNSLASSDASVKALF